LLIVHIDCGRQLILRFLWFSNSFDLYQRVTLRLANSTNTTDIPAPRNEKT